MSASKCIHALKVHPRIERALEYYCGIHHVWANPLGKCQLDISLSLSLSFSFPPSLSFSLPLSLSIPGMLSGTSYDTVVQARHDRFLLMPSRPVGRTRTRRVSGSPSQVLSHMITISIAHHLVNTCLISRCDQNVRERKILDGASERLRETHSMRDPLHFYEHISRNREATCAVQVAPSTAPCWGDSYPKWQMSRQRHSKAQQR